MEIAHSAVECAHSVVEIAYSSVEIVISTVEIAYSVVEIVISSVECAHSIVEIVISNAVWGRFCGFWTGGGLVFTLSKAYKVHWGSVLAAKACFFILWRLVPSRTALFRPFSGG